MTDVRDRMLAAIRTARGGGVDPQQVRRDAAMLLDDPASIRPALALPDVVDAFIARVVSPKVAAAAERVASLADVPPAVDRYLLANRLPMSIALQPSAALRALDWSGFDLHERAAPDEPVGVGIARWGIAETGSLVFHSSAESPVLANFLPLHHIVVVEASTIVAYLEDYVAAAAATGEKPPRNVNLITGASGTTDIEGSLVRGAHGPGYLHVIVVG